MTPQVAAAVRAAVTFAGTPKTADAARVMRAYFRASGFAEDRFGNFKVDDQTRWKLGASTVHKQSKSGGDWRNVKVTSLVDHAIALMKSAGAAINNASLLTQADAAATARADAKRTAARSRDEKFAREAARRAATMRLASTHRAQVWASLYGQRLADDVVAAMNAQMETDTEMFLAFGPPPPGTFSTLAAPPIMPVFGDYEDDWTEDGVRIHVEHHGSGPRPYASVDVYAGDEHLLIGDVYPPTRGLVSGPDRLFAQLRGIADEKPVGVLRGALGVWCKILHGYGIKAFEVRSRLLMARLQGFGFVPLDTDLARCP